MGTKEPVLIAGGISSLLTAAGALAVFYGWMDLNEVGLWIALLTVIATLGGSWWARSMVTSDHTANQAGTSTKEIKEVAVNPKMMLVAKGIPSPRSVKPT